MYYGYRTKEKQRTSGDSLTLVLEFYFLSYIITFMLTTEN